MAVGVFPVIYSTLNIEAIITEILTEYSIEQVVNCYFWHRGLSDIYLVETITNPYILRISHHHWRSQAEINFELEFLTFLQQNHLPVAAPLITQTNNLAVEVNAPEGKRYAALFPYAPGKIPLGDLNLNQSKILGETVAKLHQLSANFSCHFERKALDLNYLLNDSLDIILPFLQHRQKDIFYLKESISKLKFNLWNLPQKNPFWVTCWGDPHSGNVHFTHNNQITLFDFDQCGYGWRAFEVAKFLQLSLSVGLSKHLREAFLNGYQSILSLTDWEIKSLQAFAQTGHIWMWAISLTTAKLYDYSRLDDSYFNQRLERLKRLQSKDWELF